MNPLDLDMSPGAEMFPEASAPQYNSYTDVNMGHAVGDPLDMGVTHQQPEAATQVTDKELNFKAFREEVSKLKEEREYYKGQVDAFSKMPQRQPEQEKQEDPFASLDWEEPGHVKKAFDAVRQENVRLREEIKDALTAIETKTQRQDWNAMVSNHVPQLTSKNPIFAEMIRNTSNPYEAAYLLAELNSRANQPVQQSQVSPQGQRALDNSAKPRTLESVGGSGQLSAADYYANMSDKDFMEIAARNLANI